jgi:hypothetical protein
MFGQMFTTMMIAAQGGNYTVAMQSISTSNGPV